MKYFTLLLGYLCYAQIAKSQYNLIPNYSFEDSLVCPTTANGGPLPSPWKLAQDLPNTNLNANTCSTDPGYSVPNNNVGFQYPKSGQGYSTTDFYISFFFNGRGYLQVPLKASLLFGKKYYGEFWASLGNNSRYAVNNIAMLLTDTAVRVNSVDYPMSIGLIPANPQVYNYSNPVIRDTLNWVKISGVFTAQGGESFVTIGNFKDDDHTEIEQIHSLPGSSRKAGYYIDDVKLIPLDSMQLNADAGRDTSIYVGDSAFVGSYINGISNINWLNSTGNIIATGKPFLYVKPTTNTFYIVEQTVNGFYSRDTVNVFVNTIVPLNFVTFTLTPSPLERVGVRFSTANEINVLHFNIQQSSNGIEFTTVGKVIANNSNFNEYQYTHQPTNNQKQEPLFYRLEAVDKDGKITYSKTLQITLNHKPQTLKLYPNPAKENITILYPKIKQVIITDITGKIVKNISVLNSNSTFINITSLLKGIYLVKVIGLSNSETIKLRVE
ncbi:MAG: T9SS type A sorting domain-containing protein [Chitinophagaceae bacterium]|jgi:hypothetical protein|nr:T9SS type A sorting domain-containing protein [Chitinophagaceae bacterium]